MRYGTRQTVLILILGVAAVPLILGPTCPGPLPPLGGTSFHETWDPAVTGSSYLPEWDIPPQIPGSEGNWYLGATVTTADDTPHYAEVVGKGDAKHVRIVANRSHTDWADNIWLSWDRDRGGRSQSIPITPGTRISFVEQGELFGAPASIGWGTDNCGLQIPCGTFFVLIDTNDNAVFYRLQRPSDAAEDTSFNRIEIFIEPENGLYSRNLYDDFARIPNFNATNARIKYMQLEINPWDGSTEELGWATIDDIKIFRVAD